MRILNQILTVSMGALILPASAAAVSVFGIEFDPANATTQAWVTSGGYATPNGVALFSGGSDDWIPQAPNDPADAAVGQSMGTYFRLPTFQPGYDGSEKFGNVGSSVTLGSDPDIPALSNERDIIFTRWADGFGLANVSGPDLAVFEKATSEAFAIRVHNATVGAWSPWYYEIFNPTGPFDYATPTEYDLSDLGVGIGEVINGIEITNLTPDDEVAGSIGVFDGMTELGSGEVIFGGNDAGYAPARWSSSAASGYKAYEDGKFDPDILFVVGLSAGLTGLTQDLISDLEGVPAGASNPPRTGPALVPVPPSFVLLLSALAFASVARKPRRKTII